MKQKEKYIEAETDNSELVMAYQQPLNEVKA